MLDKLGCRGSPGQILGEQVGSKGLFILELNTQPGMTYILGTEQANFIGMSLKIFVIG